jgi:hypothetical protein
MNGVGRNLPAGSPRRSTALRIGSSWTILLAVFLVAGLASCTESMRQAMSGTPKNPEDLLATLKSDKARIDQTTDAMMKKIDTFNQARKPGERTIQFSEIFMEDLSGEQRDVLNQLLTEEKDVSYKALITKIIADRDDIQALQQKVLQLEQRLPDQFTVAKKGDDHTKLAMKYLTEEAKLDEAKAKQLVNQVDRTDVLLAGNHVWYFYDPKQDSFRTYVTQGEAGQTPLAVRRARQRKLIEERDTYKNERDVAQTARVAAEAEVADLQDRKARLEEDIAGLQRNKADLESNVDRLSRDLAFRQNSLFYHAENQRSLKDRGVLSGVLSRVKDVKGVNYDEALDLRNGTSISFNANSFGLEKIKEIRLLPPIFQEGRDFSVETSEETGSARLVILDPDLFRGREVLLAVGG